MNFKHLITARKQSLGQGNMFTGVCLSTGGGLLLGGCLLPEGCMVLEGVGPGGVCSRGGVCSGGVPGGDPRTATAAGGTHPTGMHSCLICISFMAYSDRIWIGPRRMACMIFCWTFHTTPGMGREPGPMAYQAISIPDLIPMYSHINVSRSQSHCQCEYFRVILLPPANEVCEGYVFTGVCLSTGRGSSVSVQRGWGVSVQGV